MHQLIIDRLAADLALFTAAAKTAHEAATHEENVPDNRYDTLSLEASYVAQGQANRAAELRMSLHAYQTLQLQVFSDGMPIRLTALIQLEGEDGEERTLFVGPREGGLKISTGPSDIMVITPSSPLGVQLIGQCVGDAVSIGKMEYEIVKVE